jgi:flagellar basal body P-ring formation chaperone FlgA
VQYRAQYQYACNININIKEERLMKRVATLLLTITGMLAAVALRCVAESVCSELVVQSHVEAAKGELNLADLLTHGTCSRLQQAASQVNLGAAPQAGTVRVLGGREVRQQMRQLVAGLEEGESRIRGTTVRMKIPERVVVERATRMKSCAEIAQFLASRVSQQVAAGAPRRWQNDLNCAGASAVPMEASLELTKTVWNQRLQRREFDLRCAPAADCVPFLVWAREPKSKLDAASRSSNSHLPTVLQPSPRSYRQMADAQNAVGAGEGSLVKPGQTATLEWEQAGIRVVLPVTCLDAGGMGQFVRVRFKNATGILRAEVMGEGRLRARL